MSKHDASHPSALSSQSPSPQGSPTEAPLLSASNLAGESLSAANNGLPVMVAPNGAVAVPGYEVGKLLGQGGMGVVYEAVQVRASRRVALKLLRSGAGAEMEE